MSCEYMTSCGVLTLSDAENCGRKLYVCRAAEDYSVGNFELTLVRQLGNAGQALDRKPSLP